MIALGDRCASPVRLMRHRTINSDTKTVKRWRPVKTPIEGVFIGWRTYANGTIEYRRDYEEPVVFSPKEYIKIALVVQNTRTKPVPVPAKELRTVAEFSAVEPKPQPIDCEVCYGSGKVYADPSELTNMNCSVCGGTGKVIVTVTSA